MSQKASKKKKQENILNTENGYRCMDIFNDDDDADHDDDDDDDDDNDFHLLL